MDIEEIRERFAPAIREIIDVCSVSEAFVDKDQFRVYIATIWGNAAIDPEKSGLVEEDLSLLHDYINEEIRNVLGEDETIMSCYEYLASKVGEEAMDRLNLSKQHREFVLYFARLLLN